MNFNFGEVLTRAWQHIWKHKVLWIFGILASCARGNGGGNSGGGNSRYQSSGNNPFPGNQQDFSQFGQEIGKYFQDHIAVIVAVLCVLFLLSIVFFAIGMMGRIGLIKGVCAAEKGAQSLQFGEIWAESTPYFGRIFGLNFLISAALFLLIVPFVLLTIATAGIGLFCLIPILCLMVPVGLVISVVIQQVQTSIVLEDLSIMNGIKRGWEVTKANVGPIVVMLLILGVGGGIIGTIISLPIIFAVVPIVIGANSLRETMTPVYIAIACCALYMPVLIFLNGLLTAYIQSVWTLTYMRITAPKPPQQDESPILTEANA